MKKVNESFLTHVQQRDFMRGLPFYGEKGDFNFVLGRSQFTPGVSIRTVPLTDMSIKADPGLTPFDSNVNIIRNYFKPGDRIRGIAVNSQLENEDGRIIVGKLHKVKVNYLDKTIRVFIKDPKTLEVQEIYPDTMERIFESSMLLSFSEYIKS